MDLRKALSELCWDSASNSILPEFKIYSFSEVSSEPMKWLKYILLDKFGIQSLDVVSDQIVRFPFAKIIDAKSHCELLIQQEKENLSSSMIVVKIVPWESANQLRNYRIFLPGDVNAAFEKIKVDFPGADHEIWCCQSSIDTMGFNVGGRITFPRMNAVQQLEIVWYASPRWLESVSLDDFPYPYIHATKSANELAFTTQTIYIPSMAKYQEISEGQMLCDMLCIFNELTSRRRSMQALAQILFRLGANEVCFPFKVSQGQMTVIDWDTEMESTISAKT